MDTVAITYNCVIVFVNVVLLTLAPWPAQPQLETILIVVISPKIGLADIQMVRRLLV